MIDCSRQERGHSSNFKQPGGATSVFGFGTALMVGLVDHAFYVAFECGLLCLLCWFMLFCSSFRFL